MTAAARLKPEPVDPNLARLGAIVEAVQARLREPGVSFHEDRTQVTWPEAVELARSIEHDDGWMVFVESCGELWQTQFLYLDAPQLFLRAGRILVDVTPNPARWSTTLQRLVTEATRLRVKRLGRAVPLYSEKMLVELRARCWAKWGRS